jgi:hypothetical protein
MTTGGCGSDDGRRLDRPFHFKPASVRLAGTTRPAPVEMATGVLLSKWVCVCGKLAAMVTRRTLRIRTKDKRRWLFYENEFKTPYLGSGNCRFL